MSASTLSFGMIFYIQINFNQSGQEMNVNLKARRPPIEEVFCKRKNGSSAAAPIFILHINSSKYPTPATRKN